MFACIPQMAFLGSLLGWALITLDFLYLATYLSVIGWTRGLHHRLLLVAMPSRLPASSGVQDKVLPGRMAAEKDVLNVAVCQQCGRI
jgi:hypothetical protein